MLKHEKRSIEVLLGGVGADLLIIFLSLTLSQNLAQGSLTTSESALKVLSSFVVLWMSFKIFVPSGGQKKDPLNLSLSSVFLKSVGIQLLNANPYLFWFGVFAPAVRSLSYQRTGAAAGLFLLITYLVKWLVYAKSVQFLRPSRRLFMIRMVFLVFLVSYFLRQVEV